MSHYISEEIAKRDARFQANQAKKGLIQVKVWVPANYRQLLLDTCKLWRRQCLLDQKGLDDG